MKHILSIDEIVEIVFDEYQKNRRFEHFQLLLLDSGISKEDLRAFFVYPEGESFPIEINAYTLREKLRNSGFLSKFASHLFDVIDNDKKHILAYTLEGDGYFLDENNQFYEDKEVFRIDYSEVDRVLRVNGLIIAKLQLNGENDSVFGYIYQNPNKRLKIVNDEITRGIMVGKSLDAIVKNLKFFGEARRLFFPKVGKNEIEFINPIRLSDLRKRGFDENITLLDLFPKIDTDKMG